MAKFGGGDPLSGTRQDDGSYVQDVKVVGGGSSGGPVTIADGADVAEGATTAAAYTDQTGAASGTVIGLLKGLYAAIRGTLTTSGTVVGTAAAGSATSGNPVQVAGSDGTNVRVVRTDNVGRPTVRIVDGNGTDITSGIANSDNVGAASALQVSSYNRFWNGSGWDRARGDLSGAFIGADQFFTESTAGLAANATLNGALRTNGGTAGGVGSRFSFFIAEAFSDVAGGTLFVDKTVDGGTTYRQVGSIALVANSSVSLKVPLSAAGYRVRVANGGTLQGAALVTSAFSLN